MKVTVLYTDYKYDICENLLISYCQYIPPYFINRAQKFKRWQDRQTFIIGKLLVWKGFQKYGFQDNVLSLVQEGSSGKPYIPGGLFFNISHSGRYVMVAFCKSELGIDIEEIGPVDLLDFEYIFSDKEKEFMKNTKTPTKDFFRIWALKESVIKADGRGLGLSLPSITVIEKNKVARVENDHWYVQELNISQNYCCAIATKEKVTELALEKIIFPDIRGNKES